MALKQMNNTFQKLPDHKRQRLKNVSDWKKTKKTWQLKAMWDSKLNHRTEKKDPCGESGEIWISVSFS